MGSNYVIQKHKAFPLIFVSICSLCMSFGRAAPNDYTYKTLGLPSVYETGEIIASCPNGDYIVHSVVRVSPSSNRRSRVARLNANFDIIWDSTYGCELATDDAKYASTVNSIICVSDGLYFCGSLTSYCGGTAIAYIWKSTNTWYVYPLRFSFDGSPGHPYYYEITFMELLPSNDIIAVGNYPNSGVTTGFIIKLNNGNAFQYSNSFDNMATNFYEVRIVDSTNVVIVGYHNDGTDQHAVIYLISIDTGHVFKQHYYSEPTYACTYYSVAVMKSGKFIAVGSKCYPGGTVCYYLFNIYASDLSAYSQGFSQYYWAVMRKVKEMPNGNFMIVGWSHRVINWGAWAIFVDPNGNIKPEYLDVESYEKHLEDFVIKKDDGSAVMIGYMSTAPEYNPDMYLVFREGCGNNGFFASDEITCACKSGYIRRNGKCLLLNDGSGKCSSLLDCVEQDVNKGVCNSEKCECTKDYSWVLNREGCFGLNNKQPACTTVKDCYIDDGTSDCISNKCDCKDHYLWDDISKKCRGKNDGESDCDHAISDCVYDISGFGECNTGKCACIAGYAWAEDRLLCTAMNTGLHACVNINDCIDNDVNRAECNSGYKCACKSPYLLYAYVRKKCTIPNDNSFSCDDINSCTDNDPVRANCNVAHSCICQDDYLWSNAAARCLAKSDKSIACTNMDGCFDKSGNTECSTSCNCKLGHGWVENTSKCQPYNDDRPSCTKKQDCFDSSFKAECDISTGKCTCATNYFWGSYRKYCVGKNTGLTDCTTVNNCGDYTDSGDCVGGKCVCKQYHIWKEPTGWCHCNIGTYSPSGKGRTDCTPCEQGKYQDQCGQPDCKLCPENTYLPTFGGTSILHCIACPSNSRSDPGASRCTCKDGAYDSGAPGGVGSEYCPKCHPFCALCSNKAYECSKCVSDNKGIYIVNNNCFCRIDNGFYYVPGANYLDDKCLPCHPFCKTCHGPTNEDCDSCVNGIANLQPYKNNICRCDEEYYFDVNDPSNYCKPCHKFCKECSLTATNCTVCYDNPGVKHTGKCECIAPGYFEYYNVSNPKFNKEECVNCYPLCKLCDGPYPNQCSSCFKEKGAILSGTSCICPLNYFYDSEQERCAKCNILCIGCTKNTPESCLACNTSVSFSVQNVPGLCVSDCYFLNGYYKAKSECKECHLDCIHCYGPYSYQCTLCSDPNLVMYLGKCIDACPEHFINIGGICYECHESCVNCTDNTDSGCINCQPFLYFYKNKCFKRCPDGTFAKDNYTCEKCQDPCGNCLSLEKCLTCAKKKYWYREENRCVSNEYCQSKFLYGDDLTGYCESCYFSCLTCLGPLKTDCIQCNFEKGFSRSDGDTGECLMTVCPERSYLNIDISRQIAECKKCHTTCKTCLEYGANKCTLCKIGLTPFPAEVEGYFRCKSCSEISPGFITLPDFTCQEICGDGQNMGKLECDDGNEINGDGCNNLCKIEEGYKCSHPTNGLDICIDIKPPSAILEVKKGNLLIIEFSELVTVSVDSQTLLSKYMEIMIEGLKEECPIIKNMALDFPKMTNLTSIQLRVNATCLLKGFVETYIIKFTKPAMIKDLAGNILNTPILTAKTMRAIYISPTEQAVVEGAGSSFTVSSMVTFGVVIGMSALQSTVVGGFWSFVNMVQIISYIPILKLEIPYNLQIFLTEYLTVSKVAIPFNLLPKGIPNPLDFLSAFVTDSLGENFKICGYETFSFIYNFGQELTSWACIFGFYILLCFLNVVLPVNSFKLVRRWKKDYEYNGVIRILIETHMNLVFCAFLNIWIAYPNNIARKLSLAGACVAAFLAFGFIVKSFHLVEKSSSVLETNEFKETYGNIVEDLKVKKGRLWPRYYYPIYLIRRLVYAVVLIVLIDYPFIQLWLIIFVTTIPILLYLSIVRPFDKLLDNILNIYNEAVVLISYSTVGILNSGHFKSSTVMNIGWFMVGLVLLSLAASWVVMLPGATKELYNTIKEYILGGDQSQEKIAKSQEVPKSTSEITLAKRNKPNENESEIKNDNTDAQLNRHHQHENNENNKSKKNRSKSKMRRIKIAK